jgi:hypoxanthine phosphoribosyltransferase
MNELHPELSRILIGSDQIQSRVQELAAQIDREYSHVERLYIVGILKGAFIFLADLTRQLRTPHIVDFMALSSYGKTATSGTVRILMDLRESVEGQHVLIVEDILDTGNTLSYLNRILRERKPASLHNCVLVRKTRPGVDFPIDYLGFDIPDVWVVGYGLDFADRFRTLPYIAELKKT